MMTKYIVRIFSPNVGVSQTKRHRLKVRRVVKGIRGVAFSHREWLISVYLEVVELVTITIFKRRLDRLRNRYRAVLAIFQANRICADGQSVQRGLVQPKR